MSEQNVEEPREQDGKATRPVSEGQLSQEASTTETVTRAELDAVLSELRGVQSKLDKDVNAATKKLQSNLEERMKQLGVELTPAQQMQNRLLELEDQLASVGKGEAKPQSQTVKEPQTQPVNITEIKAAYPEIDFNTPKVLQALSENVNNQDGFLAALGKIKLSGVAKPKPSSASVTPPSGNVQSSASIADLQTEYQSLLNDPVSFSKPENKARRAEIIKQMEEIENA